MANQMNVPQRGRLHYNVGYVWDNVGKESADVLRATVHGIRAETF